MPHPPRISSVQGNEARGDFEVTGPYLGEGTYGHVIRGVHVPTQTCVAIKRLKMHWCDGDPAGGGLTDSRRGRRVVGMGLTCAMREIACLQRLPPHPHIVRLHCVYTAASTSNTGGSRLHLVFDLLDVDLEQILAYRPSKEPSMNKPEVVDETLLKQQCVLRPGSIRLIMSSILSALAHCHRYGYVHRDVKPGNVLLRFSRIPIEEATSEERRGITEKLTYFFRVDAVQLADFGMVRSVPIVASRKEPCLNGGFPTAEFDDASLAIERCLREGVTNSGGLAGTGGGDIAPSGNVYLTAQTTTLYYRPPELLLGDPHYSTGCDLWSAGCILAKMLLAGKDLFLGTPTGPEYTDWRHLIDVMRIFGVSSTVAGEHPGNPTASSSYESSNVMPSNGVPDTSEGEGCPIGRSWLCRPTAALWQSLFPTLPQFNYQRCRAVDVNEGSEGARHCYHGKSSYLHHQRVLVLRSLHQTGAELKVVPSTVDAVGDEQSKCVIASKCTRCQGSLSYGGMDDDRHHLLLHTILYRLSGDNASGPKMWSDIKDLCFDCVCCTRAKDSTGLSLLERLLCVDPNQRLPADAAMDHAYFCKME